MTPNTWGGPKWAEGKKNPVTLVSTVVARNSAVQPGSLLTLNMPNSTTMPDTIAIKLMITCTAVNVAIDILRIITRLLYIVPSSGCSTGGNGGGKAGRQPAKMASGKSAETT